MGLHHQDTHGRVFRGIEAHRHLENRKRNLNSNNIKLNVPPHMKAAARINQENYLVANKVVAISEEVATYTSVVYQTLSADFDGPIAGYTTLSDNAPAASTPTVAAVAQQSAATSVASSAAPASTNADEAAYASAKNAASAAPASSTVIAISTATLSPTSSAAAAVTSSSSVEDGSNNKSMFLNAPSSALAAASTAAATLAPAAIGGTPISATRGAIAQNGTGMSTGAKAGLAIGVLLAIGLALGLLLFCWRRRRNPNAHQEIYDEKRVSNGSSLFGGKAMSEKRTSAMTDKVAPSAASTAPRLSLRPVTQFLPGLLSNNANSNASMLNPASAAMSEKPKSMWERRSQASQNPFEDADVIDEKQERSVTPTNPFEEPEAPKSPSFKSAHSTNLSLEDASKVETAAAVPVAASAPKGPNNVHRVQLDFKPSMEDELELKSGQLVRMLHAYDDGWALCIRMDRSQQGVVPRTCLSKLPVKPRPAPQPRNNGRPVSPMEPATPTAVPARKPVPGQAM